MHRAADFGQPLKPLRCTECGFRRRGENWPKKKIIRATARGCCCRFQRVTGNTNEEIFPRATIFDKPLGFRKRQTFFAKMHTAGALGDRHIQPVIHQDSRWRSFSCRGFCGLLQSFARQGTAIFAQKIFLANLNPIDARIHSGGDLRQESFLRFSRIGCGEVVTIRHVAKDRSAKCVIEAGHDQAPCANRSSRLPEGYPRPQRRSPRREMRDEAQWA